MADILTEIRYQVGEAWRGSYLGNTVYSHAAVVQDPTGLSIYRSRKSGNVGHALTDDEWWMKIIDLSDIKDASDEIVRLNGEVASAEDLRVEAEGNRADAETLRVGAESDRVLAESGRVTAETLRDNAESSRSTAERDRSGAEADRVRAESDRVDAEALRASAETARGTAYATAEGTSESTAGDGSRWGTFNQNEAMRDNICAQALQNSLLGLEWDSETTGIVRAVTGAVTGYSSDGIDPVTGVLTLQLNAA